MEVSMIGSSQVKTELAYRELGFCNLKGGKAVIPSKNRVSFGRSTGWRNSGIRFTLRATAAIQSEPLRSDSVSGCSKRSKSRDNVRLFVGLPLDSVSDCNAVNHAKAIAAGLKALKLLGVEGVELPVWWGIVEKEAMGKYEWSGYLALAEMVQNAGLKLHVSLCFHASKQHKISLPEWVSRIGESEPSIFFTDRAGKQYKECLSLAVDDLPVLDGKTPVQVYREFCESFKSSFSSFMGSTITGISMGLGPDGELQYPSHQRPVKSNKITGVGEFQCYDKNMLSILKQHAEANGNPLWGLGGPHDAPTYDDSPNSNNFFREHGGSWVSPYADFFLSWYSNQLISHGERLLSLASSTFGETATTVYGKVPLMHSWYKTPSHPSELTAGYYNTTTRDGYEAVTEMFARNSCKLMFPELLLAQIRAACRKHGVEVSGQNSSATGAPGGFEQIKKNLVGDNVVDLFIYQRMGAYFFSPEHFPSFTNFVRSLNQSELHSDDLPEEKEEAADSLRVSSDSAVRMQEA
ncbi:hypothetical protein ACJW30_02G037000 [Castanea mollissima]